MSTDPDNIHQMAPAWNGRRVVVFNGQHDTHISTGVPYDTRTLASLFALEPGNADKLDGLAFIPSTYAAHDARNHAKQREEGEFVALCGDVDHGNHPLQRIESLVRGFAVDAAWLIFSTAHARADDQRWRIIIPLARPMGYEDWHDAQHAFFNFMEYGGIEMDRALDRAGQPVYLPNVPDYHAKTGEILREDDGTPVFYKRSTTGTNAPGLALDGQLAAGLAGIARKREDDELARARIQEEAAKLRARRPRNDDSPVMEDFNRNNPIANLLELYGYQQSPRSDADWRSPHQQGDSYATRNFGDHWVSLSTSDAGKGLGARCAAGCFGDAYDLFVHYEHGGDHKAAFRALYQERRASQPRAADDMPPARHPDDPAPVNDTMDPVSLWARHEPPTLPKGLLPKIIEDYAFSQAELMGADPAGFAMAALAVCAAAIPDRIVIQVKKNDTSWRESARIWVVLIGMPSTKKSPVIKSTLRPIVKIDTAMFRQYSMAYAEYMALPSGERRGTPAPKQTRLRLSDTTMEAAQEVLCDSPEGLLLHNDELTGWFGGMDKYSGGRGSAAERSFWLKTYDGGSHVVNRTKSGRGPSVIPNMSVSLLGGIQPDPLRKLVGEAVDDGLIQRFIPVVLHRAGPDIDAPQGAQVSKYENLIAKLHRLNAPTWDGQPVKVEESGEFPVKFDDEAQIIRNDLVEKHHKMGQAEAISPKMAAHFGKYDGLFPRLCLIWHCIEHYEADVLPGIISADTARRVSNFLHAFVARHAVAFYVGLLGCGDDHDKVVAVAAHILAKRLETITNRDIQRTFKWAKGASGMDAFEVRLLCEKLESLGWLTPAPSPPKSNTPHWAVNPIVHRKFAEHGAREVERKRLAREAIMEAFNA